MKKKIVIHVPMHSDKAKSKAMKIAVAIQGVISVSIGEEDQLVVIGAGVDSVCLGKSLRKKFCFADIVTVEEVKPPPPPPPPPAPNSESSSSSCCLKYSSPPPSPKFKPCYLPPTYCPPLYYDCRLVYDADPPTCSIM